MPGTAGDIVTRERHNGEPYFLTYFRKLIPALRPHVADPELRKVFDILQSPYVNQKDAREAISKISHNFFNPQANIITGMVYLSGRREQLRGKNDLRAASKKTLLSFTPSEHDQIMRSRAAIGASRFDYMDRMTLAERLGAEQDQAEMYELLAQYNGGNKPPRESYGYATVIQFA